MMFPRVLSMGGRVVSRKRKWSQPRARSRSSSLSPSASSSSSSSSSSNQNRKLVCIQATFDTSEMKWFQVEISFGDDECEVGRKQKKKKNKMSELFGRRHHHLDGVGYGKFPTFETMLQPFSVAKFSRLGSLATIGSTLYCVGGVVPSFTKRDRNSRLVRAYDFNRPGNRWNKSLCQPIGRREMPNLVGFDGKLFVFGGTDHDIDGIPFAEVYDPSLDKWERLPDPPTDTGECQLVTAPLFGLKKIVVAESIDQDHYFYDVTARSWEKVDYPVPAEKFGCSLGLTSRVTVGNTVYGLGSMGAYLKAYDFEQMKWFTGPIKGLDHEPFLDDLFDLNYVPPLLHLGGEHFCLLWSDSLSDDIDQTCFHFTIIRVSKEYDSRGEGVINARVESCQRYLAPGNVTDLEAHLLDISLNGDDRKDESSSSVQVIGETGRMLDMCTHQAALVGDA